MVLTRLDRAGAAKLSSRLGLEVSAIEVTDDLDLFRLLVDRLSAGQRVDYVIADEAQFYQPDHIEQLAMAVDELHLDVFAFGIMTDFRTRLFPGSARLVELADRIYSLQVEALCWCGSRATQNARTVDGVMVIEGNQVLVGDVGGQADIGYEVLCRRHYRQRRTGNAAKAEHISREPLPFRD